MAEHEEYITLINARLDGALLPEEARRLDAHLATCPDCQQAERELRAIHQALQSLGRLDPPDGFHEQIMSAIAADNVLPFSAKKSDVWKKWLAAAAVIMGILGGGAVYRWQHHDAVSSTAAGGGIHEETDLSRSSSDMGLKAYTAEASPQQPMTAVAPREAEGGPAEDTLPKEPLSELEEADENLSTSGAVEKATDASGKQNGFDDMGQFFGQTYEDSQETAAPTAESSIQMNRSATAHMENADIAGAPPVEADITPREALTLVVSRVNAESKLSLTNVYQEETLSCTGFLSETDTVVYTVTYKGTSVDGIFYVFSVVSSTEGRERRYMVEVDGSDIRETSDGEETP